MQTVAVQAAPTDVVWASSMDSTLGSAFGTQPRGRADPATWASGRTKFSNSANGSGGSVMGADGAADAGGAPHEGPEGEPG